MKFKTRTYIGIQGEFLRSKVNQSIGVFDRFINDPNEPPFTVRIVPSSTRQHLDYSEDAASITLNQLLSEAWAFGAQYSFVRSELDVTHPQLTPLVRSRLDSVNGAELHNLNLSLLFNHPSGFFAQAESHWYWQQNSGAAASLPGDSFQQLNLFCGYRFPRQRGDITVGVLNATDEDYRLNPVTAYAELPRKAVFYARLRFRF